MRASAVARGTLTLTDAQRRLLDLRDGIVAAIGPSGSGKTTALAAYAAAWRRGGGNPLVVISHKSGGEAFACALRALGQDAGGYRVATFADHVAQWMRSCYVGAGVAPEIWVGGPGATRAIAARAARGLLDMTWPMFARSDINLDLPYLSKPESFLDEAASLFGLLQRARITPDEFEQGCAAGIAAFYGERTERARVLLGDPQVRQRASSRARAALRASDASLSAQRQAERDLCAILTQLFREYQSAAAGWGLRGAEDLIDAAARWLARDSQSALRIASSIDTLIIDDAEDSEPALSAVIASLLRQKTFSVVLAGCDSGRIDGLAGRRSALGGFGDPERVDMSPLGVLPASEVRRFANESDEAAWVVRQIESLIAQGCPAHEIAVLTRSVDSAASYARQMQAAGVPIVMPASLLESPHEITDLFALAALIDDAFDQEHLLRVLGSPLVGFSDASIQTLCRRAAPDAQLILDVGVAPSQEAPNAGPQARTLARNVFDDCVDDALSDVARSSLRTLRESLARWRRSCGFMAPPQRLLYLAEAAGFLDSWHARDTHVRERLRDDLERVVGAAAQATAALGSSTAADIEKLLEAEVLQLRPARLTEGAVVADSIVAVKGLRFRHVFVVGVAWERFPRIYTSHAMAFSRTYGLIVRENVSRGTAQTAKFAWYYGRFGAKSMYLDEERRALAYGLSRASTSATATGFGVPPNWAKDHDLLASFPSGDRPTQDAAQ